MSNSTRSQHSNPATNSSRLPAGLHTSHSLDTITGNGLFASPTETHFPESDPNPDSADAHYMTFSEHLAEGGRHADKLDMAGTMLSLGSDPSMDSFGSGCEFQQLPGFAAVSMPAAAEAGIRDYAQPTLPESDVGISRRFTSHVPQQGLKSVDMSPRSTARPGRRFGSVVLHYTRMSSAYLEVIKLMIVSKERICPSVDWGCVLDSSGSRECPE